MDLIIVGVLLLVLLAIVIQSYNIWGTNNKIGNLLSLKNKINGITKRITKNNKSTNERLLSAKGSIASIGKIVKNHEKWIKETTDVLVSQERDYKQRNERVDEYLDNLAKANNGNDELNISRFSSIADAFIEMETEINKMQQFRNAQMNQNKANEDLVMGLVDIMDGQRQLILDLAEATLTNPLKARPKKRVVLSRNRY